MSPGPGSPKRGSTTLRWILLALCGAFLLSAPVHAAAQSLPTDPCLTDPVGCLPELDPCVANPASCVPDVDLEVQPEVDPCVENPASCVPPVADPCVSDPSACLSSEPPSTSDPEACVESPLACLEPDDRPAQGPRDESEQQKDAVVVPARGNDAPPSDRSGRGGSPSRAVSERVRTAPVPQEQVGAGAATSPPKPTESSITRLGRGLQHAADRFAFPLALAAVVAAFLFVQGRIDGRDPKLAVAPIDSRDDLVMYQ